MKKSYILILFTFLGISLYAQENIDFTKRKEILSPEINADKTVTFRLDAKNAKSVILQGDCVPESGNLSKNEDGIWTYTTKPLNPEFYSYTFIVDGIKTLDPNNAFVTRDVATIVNVFLVDGEFADLYKVNDVPHGSVSKRWYDSPSLKTTKRVTVYTPPGYEKSKEKYPVLYLLHGAGGDEEAWMQLGRTSQILDNLIAQGKAKPMLVVMTNGNARQNAAPGESSEGYIKPVFIRPEMFSGLTEKAFGDVIAFIESEYRVKKEKASRAIAGLSMGGMQTIVIAANYPNTFDYIGVFSSAMLQPADNKVDFYLNMNQKLLTQKSNAFKLYWIGIGKDDFLYQKCVEFRSELDKANLKYIYKETNGGHTWSNWRVYLSEFVPQLFK
ncbi:alpha/beta hydrolase-fold protein [Flavobacterium sp. SUN052]|uniref:esterase n=1 Tax=Flavobacterium sp. SUN052 TaxID=3002441 RepID=UPI00237DD236|nr:esterase [Flavobacterium sp. SUN052]MEC4003422.1 alpha/beta hydrolase-fold protein [Flavobacterium sp. SUN052]